MPRWKPGSQLVSVTVPVKVRKVPMLSISPATVPLADVYKRQSSYGLSMLVPIDVTLLLALLEHVGAC